MPMSFRKLTVLVAFLAFAAACKQQDAPEMPPSNRGSSGSSDQAALAQAFVTLLYIAAKQARENGECQRPLNQQSSDRQGLLLLCERLARQEASRASARLNSGLIKGANPPKE